MTDIIHHNQTDLLTLLDMPDVLLSELALLREPADDDQAVIDIDEQDEEVRENQHSVICRACGHSITSTNHGISVSGSHRHTFFNPAGIVFELACFRQAPGCSVVGESSAEFTWFAGYLWRVALCSRCGSHLGWQFISSDTSFYGLIIANLQDV